MLLPLALASCTGPNDDKADAETGTDTGTPVECGNGVVEGEEECDNGTANGSDKLCTAECTNVAADCGDDVEQVGEECDDGNTIDADECSNSCKIPVCGDGVVQLELEEECDDENDDDTDGCTNDCKSAKCGDSIVQTGEECDSGPENADDALCTSQCMVAYCGDNLVGPGETCDDANDVDNDDCTNNCISADCGDTIIQEEQGETCDDGNMDDSDACTNACTLAECGDGHTWEGMEGCDDANTDNINDMCTTLCQPPSCDDELLSGDELDVDCGGSTCDSCFGLTQHTWKGAVQVGSPWAPIVAANHQITTHGGPLEIELSIPLVGGGDSACRPTINGQWAGNFEGLDGSYLWHEGRERTGWNNPYGFRLWSRMRVYYNIPAGEHTLGVECVTNSISPVSVGRENSSSVIVTREYDQVDNRVHQKVSLMATTVGNQDLMVLLPGSELMANVGGTIEVAISVPISNGGHAACLPWMDDEPILSDPVYTGGRWGAGLTSTYASRTLWTHSRVYTIPEGPHEFDIRCHNSENNLNIGELNAASVIIVRELDNVTQDVAQGLDTNGNGYEINGNVASGTWAPMPYHQATVTVTHGTLDVTSVAQYYDVNSQAWLTCRPVLGGEWLGSFAADFESDEEEGVVHQLSSDGYHGMWYRRRLYTNIPPGSPSIGLQCLSSSNAYYVGNHGHGTLTVRDVPLINGD